LLHATFTRWFGLLMPVLRTTHSVLFIPHTLMPDHAVIRNGPRRFTPRFGPYPHHSGDYRPVGLQPDCYITTGPTLPTTSSHLPTHGAGPTANPVATVTTHSATTCCQTSGPVTFTLLLPLHTLRWTFIRWTVAPHRQRVVTPFLWRDYAYIYGYGCPSYPIPIHHHRWNRALYVYVSATGCVLTAPPYTTHVRAIHTPDHTTFTLPATHGHVFTGSPTRPHRYVTDIPLLRIRSGWDHIAVTGCQLQLHFPDIRLTHYRVYTLHTHTFIGRWDSQLPTPHVTRLYGYVTTVVVTPSYRYVTHAITHVWTLPGSRITPHSLDVYRYGSPHSVTQFHTVVLRVTHTYTVTTRLPAGYGTCPVG